MKQSKNLFEAAFEKSPHGDQALDKIMDGEDDHQGKQMKKKKKKKHSEESKHKDDFQLKSNEGENDDQSKLNKKKQKLSEENKHKECNEFKSKEGADDNQGQLMKKKRKLSEESEHKDVELKSNEGESDDQSKKMKKKKKKKKLSEESKSNEGEDDEQGKKMKKKMKKLSEESKSNEGEDNDQGQLMKKRKLSIESKHEEDNGFKSNEGENDGKSKKMKKRKKLSEESKHKEDNEFKSNEGENDDQSKNMKKKKKNLSEESKRKEHKFTSNDGQDDGQGKPVKKKLSDKSKENSKKMKKKAKRVTFSDQVVICCDGLVRGKRFTPEEDEKINKAVFDYIESHGLGDDGLDMILNCKSHPEVRDCWKEIGAALPERPNMSVYYRAHILLERDEKRKWTPEEIEYLKKAQEQHGSDWKSIAKALGKHRFHVKDAWRRIKLKNANKGRWSQEEYQNLFDLVNLDLRARALEGFRKSKHGMLRDNISWEAIGDKLTTRTSQRCCKKWYEQLTSPMVASGVWSDTDDYRLLNALFDLDACCMEEVDWDNLLEHRSGDLCRKRWNQMVQHIGEHGQKSFAEQVEILSQRFCPDLLEAREAFDNKPVVC